ncbi:MAG: hypothetical protein A2Z29_08485 [Chloroflexi bacterium RBG_16_56_11]|nr:MAG: hypothetical protein A2Z29_08485 [Chloroflexi bacterium RBG_16_56_11]
MGRKRLGGFIFVTYKGDHRPYHVHIRKGNREIGRWDIENQVPLDSFELTDKLRRALVKLGYAARR